MLGNIQRTKRHKGAHSKWEAENVSEPLQSEVQSDVSQGKRDYLFYDHLIFIILKYIDFSYLITIPKLFKQVVKM